MLYKVISQIRNAIFEYGIPVIVHFLYSELNLKPKKIDHLKTMLNVEIKFDSSSVILEKIIILNKKFGEGLSIKQSF